jgi:hypothetical protein
MKLKLKLSEPVGFMGFGWVFCLNRDLWDYWEREKKFFFLLILLISEILQNRGSDKSIGLAFHTFSKS